MPTTSDPNVALAELRPARAPALPPVDADAIRTISERVYKNQLGASDTAKMLAEPKHNAPKTSERFEVPI